MSDLIERDAALRLISAHFNAPRPVSGALLWDAVSAIPAASVTGTKPSIDWSHVAPQFNWLARDKSGDLYLHARAPEQNGEGWDTRIGLWCPTRGFASATPGTCDWRDSLVMRPGHVEAAE